MALSIGASKRFNSFMGRRERALWLNYEVTIEVFMGFKQMPPRTCDSEV